MPPYLLSKQLINGNISRIVPVLSFLSRTFYMCSNKHTSAHPLRQVVRWCYDSFIFQRDTAWFCLSSGFLFWRVLTLIGYIATSRSGMTCPGRSAYVAACGQDYLKLLLVCTILIFLNQRPKKYVFIPHTHVCFNSTYVCEQGLSFLWWRRSSKPKDQISARVITRTGLDSAWKVMFQILNPMKPNVLTLHAKDKTSEDSMTWASFTFVRYLQQQNVQMFAHIASSVLPPTHTVNTRMQNNFRGAQERVCVCEREGWGAVTWCPSIFLTSPNPIPRGLTEFNPQH